MSANMQRLAPVTTTAMAATDLDDLGEEIASLALHISAATYRLLVLLREFDERAGWGCGFRSCAHWLAWRTSTDLGSAREKVRVARALNDLPHLAEAMQTGRLSYSKVRALTRVATPANEHELLHFAAAGTTAHVERLVRAYRSLDRRAALERDNQRHLARYLRVHTDEDGMVVLHARLEPEAGALVMKALQAAEDRLFAQADKNAPAPAEREAPEQRRADALALVARSALDNSLDSGTRGDRYQVVLHVETQSCATPDRDDDHTTLEGTDISCETSRRLACDASCVVMHHDQHGNVLDVGRKTRTIHPALRRALDHRDRNCRFPGCNSTFCEAHHIEHWADGGATSLSNLTLLCKFHHRALHEGGFGMTWRSDGRLEFFRPDGRPLPTVPRAEELRDDVVSVLRLESRIEDDSLASGIDASSLCPDAAPGDPCDYDWAVQYLWSLRDSAPGHEHASAETLC
jgi:hypothetical protein